MPERTSMYLILKSWAVLTSRQTDIRDIIKGSRFTITITYSLPENNRIKGSRMSKPVDMELKQAFLNLQTKMVETSKKIQVIDAQISVLDRVSNIVDATKREIYALPPDTRTYETVGRIFLHTDLEVVKSHLNRKVAQLTERTIELENNKQYLEKNLKESEDNIREMVQQRKGQPEKSS